MMIEIFFSYAHADEDLMNEVRRQLIIQERNGRIVKWYDRQIPPGNQWKNHIDAHLNAAQIILLFVSPHFIESKYCYEIEGRRALARQKQGTARVIPVILRPCPWHDAPFGELQALPLDGKPISQWDDVDIASLDVANGVMKVVDELMLEEDRRAGRHSRVAGRGKAATKPGAPKTKARKRANKPAQPTGHARKRRESKRRPRPARG
jgi:hypothetical protein